PSVLLPTADRLRIYATDAPSAGRRRSRRTPRIGWTPRRDAGSARRERRTLLRRCLPVGTDLARARHGERVGCPRIRTGTRVALQDTPRACRSRDRAGGRSEALRLAPPRLDARDTTDARHRSGRHHRGRTDARGVGAAGFRGPCELPVARPRGRVALRGEERV